ncbi:MAG: methylated-DNA--[protein]-cysteine S-methyltransferase [Lentisphaeria bacterium]
MRPTVVPSSHPVFRATPFGVVAVLWAPGRDGAEVCRLWLPRPERLAREAVAAVCPGVPAAGCAAISALLDQVEALLNGAAVSFTLGGLRLDRCSAFQQRILRATHAIPRGRVSTYRLLARQAGAPGGARAAGMALAANPFPLVIPCHRVVRSGGALGGYGGGAAMKRALLALEGMPFRDAAHVLCGPEFGGNPARPPPHSEDSLEAGLNTGRLPFEFTL